MDTKESGQSILVVMYDVIMQVVKDKPVITRASKGKSMIIFFALIVLEAVYVMTNTVSRPRYSTDVIVDDNMFNDVTENTHNTQQAERTDSLQDVTNVRDAINKADNSEGSDNVIELINGSSIQSGNIVDDVLSKFKNFNKPKKGEDWSDGTFRRALKDLGVFDLKGVKVVKLKSSNIDELKKTAHGIKVVKATKPRRKTKITKSASADDPLSNQNAVLEKRVNGYDLCTEYVDSMYVLAHTSGQLAYKVESVRCEGNCHSSTYNMDFGTCNLATKTMTVYIINSQGSFVSETITPGCACECLFTNN